MLYIAALIMVLGAFVLAPKTVLRLFYILLCALVGLPLGFLWGLLTPQVNPSRQAYMRYAWKSITHAVGKARIPAFPRIRVRVPLVSWWIDCYRYGRRYPHRALRGLYYGIVLARILRFK